MVLSRLTRITGPGIKTDTNWVGNNANFTGVTTSGTSFNIGVTTIHSNLIEAHNIVSTGIVTAVGANFTGDVNVGGVLTYEDVTSIDSVGIITAQSGIHVGAGVSVVGVGTFNSDIHLGQFVVHKGDTTTHFGFDVPNQIEFTAGNNERLRITSSGNVHFA